MPTSLGGEGNKLCWKMHRTGSRTLASMKGSLLVYANKLGWGRESALLEDASDWLEDIGFNEGITSGVCQQA